MVEIDVIYEGTLHTNATHGPSGARLSTDAPKDNMGRGESFSPTDLVATAMGTCMVTTMGIVAQRHGVDLNGTTVRVLKEMTSVPSRRIARLTCEIAVPHSFDAETQQRLEHAAHTCPVRMSVHPEMQVPVTFRWGGPGK